MKTLKGVLIGFMLLASASLFAQKGGNAMGKGRNLDGAKIEKFKTELNLTDEQVAQWKEIHKKYSPQLKAIREDQTIARKEKMEKSKPILDQKDSELKGILTPEQFEQYTAHRDEHRKQNRKLRKQKRG